MQGDGVATLADDQEVIYMRKTTKLKGEVESGNKPQELRQR
jgi:hypothetical protein